MILKAGNKLYLLKKVGWIKYFEEVIRKIISKLLDKIKVKVNKKKIHLFF